MRKLLCGIVFALSFFAARSVFGQLLTAESAKFDVVNDAGSQAVDAGQRGNTQGK